MRRFEELEFFNVSTSDDPHLQELAPASGTAPE